MGGTTEEEWGTTTGMWETTKDGGATEDGWGQLRTRVGNNKTTKPELLELYLARAMAEPGVVSTPSPKWLSKRSTGYAEAAQAAKAARGAVAASMDALRLAVQQHAQSKVCSCCRRSTVKHQWANGWEGHCRNMPGLCPQSWATGLLGTWTSFLVCSSNSLHVLPSI